MSAYRHGIVTRVDDARARARVRFPDRDGIESWWLDVVQAKTQDDQAYWLPDVGELVACLVDARAEAGCIVGALYSAADPPPVASRDKRHVRFKDGAVFEYDRAASRWRVTVPGDITLEASGTITLTAPALVIDANVTLNGDIAMSGKAELSGNLTAGGVSLGDHVHGGVVSGGNTTEGPQ